MELKLLRISTGDDSTYGCLYIDDVFQCFTLENEYHEVKIPKKTRIPEGKYKITLRKEGGYHERYVSKFGEAFHKGMLYLNDVPNFEYILIHTGNKPEHTDGCILVGNSIVNNNSIDNGYIGASTDAYRSLYPKVRDSLMRNEDVFIDIMDMDRRKEG